MFFYRLVSLIFDENNSDDRHNVFNYLYSRVNHCRRFHGISGQANKETQKRKKLKEDIKKKQPKSW